MNTFFMAILASFSTILGYFIIYIKKNTNKIIFLSLFVSSLIILYISLFDLLKEGIRLLNNKNIFIILLFIILGMYITYLINKKFNNYDSLYRVGVISVISLILHNIPEGIITYFSSKLSNDLGIKLILAISLHNIPEGITISVPIYYSTKNKFKTFLFVFISGFSELTGYLLSMLFIKDINNNFLGCLLLIVTGIMMYLSYYLFIESFRYKKEKGSPLLFT